MWLHSSVGRASHRYRGNPVEALIFFRLLLSSCLNWKIYCDDHTSLSKISIIRQFWLSIYLCRLNSIYQVLFGNIQEATLRLEDCILFPRSNDLHFSEACFPLTTFQSFLSFKVLVQRIQFSRFSNNAAYIMKQCLFLKSSLIA